MAQLTLRKTGQILFPRNSTVGIDPGVSCGTAIYYGQKLYGLWTFSPYGLLRMMQNENFDLVVIEDSRLTSPIFTAKGQNQASALKIARNVGEVDCICKMVQDLCEANNFPIVQISPKDKGAKVNAEEFKAITGWQGKTNQHERDAAMVAWRFRRGGHQKTLDMIHES